MTRLSGGDWNQAIKDLSTLGRVMCLTRNQDAVHERYGEFLKTDFFHGMGQVVGPDIDLRLFMNHWVHGFAVTDVTPDGDRQSFQFFDATGDAVHKVYLQKESNYGGYGVMLNKYRSEDQSTTVAVQPAPAPRPEMPDAEIDVAGFQQAWLEMKDTHAFFIIMGKFQCLAVTGSAPGSGRTLPARFRAGVHRRKCSRQPPLRTRRDHGVHRQPLAACRFTPVRSRTSRCSAKIG